MIIKKSSLPVSRVGKVASTLSVTIADNGQIRFSRLASQALGDDCKALWIDWDETKRTLRFVGRKPKDSSVEDAFALGFNKQSYEKGGNKDYYFSAAGVLNLIKYDYRESGTQVFNANSKDGSHVVEVINLPYKLAPRPKVARKAKKNG